VIEYEEQAKELREKKKELLKEIADLKYVTLAQGKQLDKLVNHPKELNDTESLLFKLKVLRKKEEAMREDVDKQAVVIKAIQGKIQESLGKVEKERQKVEAAERKQAERQQRLAEITGEDRKTKEQEYRSHIAALSINNDFQENEKLLEELK